MKTVLLLSSAVIAAAMVLVPAVAAEAKAPTPKSVVHRVCPPVWHP